MPVSHSERALILPAWHAKLSSTPSTVPLWMNVPVSAWRPSWHPGEIITATGDSRQRGGDAGTAAIPADISPESCQDAYLQSLAPTSDRP